MKFKFKSLACLLLLQLTYCNVLGYLTPLRHVFTLLITSEHQMWRARVLETTVGLLFWFIYDFNSRHYNLFLQCALSLWRSVLERSWFLCSGPLISFDVVSSDLCWSLLGSAEFICLLICRRAAEQSSSLLPAKSQHGHSWHRAPLGPMAIYLFSIKTCFFFVSLFLLW
jgi:hypothetical protein